ncbi:peptide ABC transporter substrate-binding protein [Streptomyces sp. SP18CS02]|uniref:peptide ABC transporter substrate-binding protein n=1 Tax=Streptomyces sp. SP18CS02 TaxID=3002531 RepID=UPI002E77AEB3|nr:ABC transporter substrate-binding protein [Streptomyces sp. SP18CS02]MEE1756365.1 ABC transporter substrate-binding protein [Streptomyces sp. SP18CS02]
MRGAKSAKWVAGAIVVALAATACGGSDSGSKGGGARQVVMELGEPQNGLIPSNTYESEGGEVMNALFTGLVKYDEKNEAQLDLAASIETKDSKVWTIKLKDGYTFHNGEPVTAQSFADAWNYGANQKNTQETNPLFSKIDGYADLNPGAGKEPTTDKMKGLKALDEKTLEVTLAAPFSAFKTMLGFNAFYPLPKAFFKDPKGFETAPVGNGLFKMDGKFVRNQQIKTVKYDKHPDAGQLKISGVTFKIYTSQDTAYRDLIGGRVDIMDTIPLSAMPTASKDLGERYIQGTDSGVGYIGFPLKYNKTYEKPEIRKAISMAIDRKAITEKIFVNTRTPADDFINPLVPGYRQGACGPACTYNPAEAKKAFDAAGGVPGNTIELGYNADGGHKDWMQAVAGQLEKNLGIKVTVKPFEQFQAILNDLGDKKYGGGFRMAWSMDYPAAENYLRPVFSKIAIENGSNYSGYINEDVEKLLNQGDTAATEDAAVKAYQQADDILLKDMPYIPVYFYKLNAGVSKNIKPGVRIDNMTQVDWTTVNPA